MTDRKITVTFVTSADEDSKKNNESITTTTTIIFKDWTEADFDVSAAKNVIINKIQPLIRKGKRIEKEFVASRPGSKGIVQMSPWDALVLVFGGDKIQAAKMSDQFGGAENALAKLRMLQAAMLNEVKEDE